MPIPKVISCISFHHGHPVWGPILGFDDFLFVSGPLVGVGPGWANKKHDVPMTAARKTWQSNVINHPYVDGSYHPYRNGKIGGCFVITLPTGLAEYPVSTWAHWGRVPMEMINPCFTTYSLKGSRSRYNSNFWWLPSGYDYQFAMENHHV